MKELKMFATMVLLAGPAGAQDMPVYERAGTIEIGFGEK